MSPENVENVHRWYEAVRRGDKEACVRESDARVEIVSYLMGVEGTVYTGHVGMRRYIDDVFSVFPDFHPEVGRTLDYGDTVVAEIRMAGRGASSGLPIEQTTWQVTSFRRLCKWVHRSDLSVRLDSPCNLLQWSARRGMASNWFS